MVDAAARAQLADILERYLAEQISAFDFDDAMDDFLSSKTADDTVREVSSLLWSIYDDLDDHLVVADKQQWDLFQRLLLVLRSDAEMVRTQPSRWTMRQPLAMLGLVAFTAAVFYFDWNAQLLLVCLPLGLLSAALSVWRSRDEDGQEQSDLRLFPFTSVAQLLAVRRRVSGFAKQPYPEHLRSRRIRERGPGVVIWLLSTLVRLCFSPLLLLGQAMPEDELNWLVSTAADPGTNAPATSCSD